MAWKLKPLLQLTFQVPTIQKAFWKIKKIRHGSCPQEKNKQNNYKIEEENGNISVSKEVLWLLISKELVSFI